MRHRRHRRSRCFVLPASNTAAAQRMRNETDLEWERWANISEKLSPQSAAGARRTINGAEMRYSRCQGYSNKIQLKRGSKSTTNNWARLPTWFLSNNHLCIKGRWLCESASAKLPCRILEWLIHKEAADIIIFSKFRMLDEARYLKWFRVYLHGWLHTYSMLRSPSYILHTYTPTCRWSFPTIANVMSITKPGSEVAT